MKKIHAFLLKLVTYHKGPDGKPRPIDALRITSKKTGLILNNPKPFDLGTLSALAKAEGLQVMFNEVPTLFEGRLQAPCVFVGIGKPDATDEETLSFLEGLKQQ